MCYPSHITMTKEERENAILNQLQVHGSALVTELSALLEVSTVTIRKDLTELERNGKLYRSHGKAILINPFTNNRTVSEKEKLNADLKLLIGKEAARLITPNDSIVIASGTTIHALARSIQPVSKLTVVSASLPASLALVQDRNVDIIQLGGMMRHSSESVVGNYAEQFLSECAFSKLFLGVDGIDFDYGLTTTDLREATLNQKMMAAAQKIIVLADSSKFGRRGFARICDLTDVDMIITDYKISQKNIDALEAQGIELVIARPDEEV